MFTITLIFYIHYLNIFGIESTVASYKFTILPPWYRTTLAYIIYMLLAFGFIYMVVNLFTSNLNRIIKKQTAELHQQKDEIVRKNKEITDSIYYAKHIQDAIMPNNEYIKNMFADSFVLFKPKDIVSGDFYWANLSENNAILAAVDCTGHGVPGAFMSMLGMSFLNEIVIENINLKPADVLNKLRKKIISALEHGGKGNIEQKDGMDVALCVWHKESNLLEYAGANNPVWIIRPIKGSKAHEIIELKANRMPVGYHYDVKDFTAQEFQLQKGDAIYLFTDGFVDQFGGPDGKKYKSKKFKEMLLTLQHLSMKDQALMINKEFNDWRGDNEQIDDLCLVGVKVV